MRIPLTLSIYIGRNFLIAILLTLCVMIVIIGMIELLELVRRGADATKSVPFGVILQMMILKLPTSIAKIYPFTFMIGGMIALGRLTRSSELVVTRSAGVSVWQFLAPGIAVSLVLGTFFVTVVNPIAALTIARYDRLEGKYISGKPSLLSVLPSGLWLRQGSEKGIAVHGTPAQEYIFRATRMDQTTLQFESVTMFLFAANHQFLGRIDAPLAMLQTGHWAIPSAVLSIPGKLPETLTDYQMPTHLTLNQIKDSFSAPEAFSFWQLPGFIAVLEKAGFSALHHKLYFHSLMALPMLLAGMVMLAAVFSLRPPRRGKTGALVVVGVASGFLIYFTTNIIYAFGASGGLPIALAAWAPTLIVIMVASAALLHLEDG